ncbi:hypothetical protein B0T16DRAFT_398824 [Cercophora newfieldiana]|uniref:Galactosyl transferase GMA12/MNN10 family protein n=1 Tax=Cercophora newfieldiana TaxID=92897 RepID=A0AA39YP90_9PEZI|nr:hypothetical protein B0T16DRAFT_398824 [Cercophora newfieldiana]
MLIHGIHRTKPAKAVLVLLLLCFVWAWLSNVQGVRLTDDLIPGRHHVDKSTKHTGKLRSRVGKVTVAANKLASDVIHRALLSHERHNARHGYVHYIAEHQAVSGLIEHDRLHRAKGAWTKPAYLLSIIVAELEKPEEERLEWIYWFDADTLVMNTETPLEVFLPPANSSALSEVDLLITTNWDGLNSGVFALRVSPWSVSLLSAVLAYPIYEAPRTQKDRFRDQSAFQFLLENGESPLANVPMKGRDRWVKVPMRWFNSLPVNNAFFKNGTWIFGKNMTKAMFDNGTTEVFDDGHGGKVNPWKVMQGDLVVHFAGSSNVRDSWMEPWVERAEANLPEWNNATTKYLLKEEAAEFWKKTEEQLVIDKAKSKIEEEQKKKAQKEREKKEKKEKEEKDKAEKERLEQVRIEKEQKAKDAAEKKIATAEKKRLDAENKAIQKHDKKLAKEKVQEQKASARAQKAALAKQTATQLITDTARSHPANKTAVASVSTATQLTPSSASR